MHPDSAFVQRTLTAQSAPGDPDHQRRSNEMLSSVMSGFIDGVSTDIVLLSDITQDVVGTVARHCESELSKMNQVLAKSYFGRGATVSVSIQIAPSSKPPQVATSSSDTRFRLYGEAGDHGMRMVKIERAPEEQEMVR